MMACVQGTSDPTPISYQMYEMVVPTVSPDVDAARAQSIPGNGLGDKYQGLVTFEEIILRSDTIARVEYLNNRTEVVRITFENEGRGDSVFWIARIEFRFRVHEYLKGSGPTEIGAFTGMLYEHEEDARQMATLLPNLHDARWDDREAIVFLNYPEERPWGPVGPDQYWLNYVGVYTKAFDRYSVASRHAKLWLPEATQGSTGGRSATTAEKLFMTDVPSESSTVARSAATTTVVVPTIRLSDMKTKISALEAEANAGGTPEYRKCVERYYYSLRFIEFLTEARGGGRTYPPKVRSGHQIWHACGYSGAGASQYL